jgi:DNA gyrase subunit A
MATRSGQEHPLPEKQVREVGRAGKGVRGIRLAKNDLVIGMEVVQEGKSLLTATEKGLASERIYPPTAGRAGVARVS